VERLLFEYLLREPGFEEPIFPHFLKCFIMDGTSTIILGIIS